MSIKEDLYKIFLTYTANEFLEKIVDSNDKNEKNFYVNLYNMVLKKEQEKLIDFDEQKNK